jgi:uncharacterized membrane protein YGL010W
MVIQNLGKFTFGFIIGMMIEWVGIWVYNKIDPNAESNVKLITLVLLQLFILFGIMEKLNVMNDVYTRVGMLSSQVFVFDYAIKRLYPFKDYLKR